jgi:hypothetical protein
MIRDVTNLLSSRGVLLPQSTPVLVFLLYALAMGSTLLYLAFKHSERLQRVEPRLYVYFACVVYMLTMPRVKDYTYCILLIPALFALRHLKPGPHIPLLALLVVVPPATTYVPGLGHKALAWLHSYSTVVCAALMFVLLARHILSALARDTQVEPARPKTP